jgi:hypothetical protein
MSTYRRKVEKDDKTPIIKILLDGEEDDDDDIDTPRPIYSDT